MRRWLNMNAEGGGGAVAAPAAVEAPPSMAPAPTPIQVAMEAARARMAAGEPLVPVAAPEQPRAPDGTFAAPEAPKVEAPAGEAPPEGEAPAAETPAGEEAPAEGPDPLVVEIPARREGDEPELYTAATPEQAERLRQLVNGYQRGETLQRTEFKLRAEREALANIQAQLQLDPEGFLFEQIPQDRAASVALQVLLQPNVWSEVNDVLQELMGDDDKRELVRLSLENARYQNRDAVQAQMQLQREANQSAVAVKQTIAMLIPETLSEPDQVALYQACQRDVVEYAERLGLNKLDPRDVPLIVAQRLRASGVDPVKAAAALLPKPAGVSSQNGAARNGAPRAPARPAPSVQPTGKDFVAAQAAARNAATTLPVGAGSPSSAANPMPPAGQTIEERIAWSRANLKFTG